MTLTANAIKEKLQQFYGTEQYFYRLNPLEQRTGMVYTDGVKEFCKIADAQWFVDLMNSYMPEIQKENTKSGDLFNLVTLTVKPIKDGKHAGCNLCMTIQHDTGMPKFIEQYDITDLPEGEYKFYLIGDTVQHVLLLPTEY